MKRFALTLVLLLMANLGFAEEVQSYPAEDYAFVRIFAASRKDPKWKAAKSLRDRMWVLYYKSHEFSASSDPVSDRYMITCYGGPIDLVHFWGLAATITKGVKLEDALYKQWEDEGGRENLKGFNYKEPPEAHPDDLPSNAFGALFAQEILKHKDDLNFNLQAAFQEFMAPLIIVPDKVAKKFSHDTIVMGYSDAPTERDKQKAQTYYTAEPLVRCRAINQAARDVLGNSLCENAETGMQALRLAGFRLFSYKKRPIIIRRDPRAQLRRKKKRKYNY